MERHVGDRRLLRVLLGGLEASVDAGLKITGEIAEEVGEVVRGVDWGSLELQWADLRLTCSEQQRPDQAAPLLVAARVILRETRHVYGSDTASSCRSSHCWYRWEEGSCECCW